MVAIVSGNTLGLNLTSLATLGQRGVSGGASQGRNGELTYVNVANGNLVLQNRDDLLVSRGVDVSALRTYNSQGLLNDDNGDNWSHGIFLQQLRLTGGRNAAGSTHLVVDVQGFYSTSDGEEGGGAHQAVGGGLRNSLIREELEGEDEVAVWRVSWRTWAA